jgi:hypothetical protein
MLHFKRAVCLCHNFVVCAVVTAHNLQIKFMQIAPLQKDCVSTAALAAAAVHPPFLRPKPPAQQFRPLGSVTAYEEYALPKYYSHITDPAELAEKIAACMVEFRAFQNGAGWHGRPASIKLAQEPDTPGDYWDAARESAPMSAQLNRKLSTSFSGQG